jgi:hypothetical protein
MEVHHHPGIEKKNFMQYFLEFLMIFLAVTLGFFAESLREHLHNNEIAKESIQSMVEDLRSDFSMYREMLAANEYSVRMNDTLTTMLGENSTNTGHMYFLARNITAVADEVRPNTRTFEQMKAAGSFYLVQNKNVLDSITLYYQSLKWFDFGNTLETQKFYEVQNSNCLLFSGTVLKKITTSEYINTEHNTVRVLEPVGNPPSANSDPAIINAAIVRYSYLATIIQENNGTSALEMHRCMRLIDLLKKEYHLK